MIKDIPMLIVCGRMVISEIANICCGWRSSNWLIERNDLMPRLKKMLSRNQIELKNKLKPRSVVGLSALEEEDWFWECGMNLAIKPPNPAPKSQQNNIKLRDNSLP